MTAQEPLLEVAGLRVEFPAGRSSIVAVRDVSFSVDAGESLCIVGESGSGKSLTCLSILNMIPPPGRIMNGRITFRGDDLLTMPDARMRRIRGAEISMVFQDPSATLNPLFTIGYQLMTVIQAHWGAGRKVARERALEVLAAVGFSDPARRLGAYPFQLSGGLRQRVSIAMALACRPKLILADEPTTNLDVSIQAQIIDLLRSLKRELDFTIIFVSHDLGVVANIADRVIVMYAGDVVESGSVLDTLRAPAHPYTQGLLQSAPTLASRRTDRLQPITGTRPDLNQLPPGCPFTSRCPVVIDGVCRDIRPQLAECAEGHRVACHHYPGATKSECTDRSRSHR